MKQIKSNYYLFIVLATLAFLQACDNQDAIPTPGVQYSNLDEYISQQDHVKNKSKAGRTLTCNSIPTYKASSTYVNTNTFDGGCSTVGQLTRYYFNLRDDSSFGIQSSIADFTIEMISAIPALTLNKAHVNYYNATSLEGTLEFSPDVDGKIYVSGWGYCNRPSVTWAEVQVFIGSTSSNTYSPVIEIGPWDSDPDPLFNGSAYFPENEFSIQLPQTLSGGEYSAQTWSIVSNYPGNGGQICHQSWASISIETGSVAPNGHLFTNFKVQHKLSRKDGYGTPVITDYYGTIPCGDIRNSIPVFSGILYSLNTPTWSEWTITNIWDDHTIGSPSSTKFTIMNPSYCGDD